MGLRRPGLRIVALAGAALLLFAGACQTTPHAELSVDPSASAYDRSWTIRASGLPAGQPAVITVEATDPSGQLWRSRIDRTTGPSGQLQTNDAAPIASMVMVNGPATGGFLYPRAGQSLTFRFTVSSGATSATATQTRSLPAEDVQELHRPTDGFTGVLYRPRDDQRHPAVLIIGGSEGGNSGLLLAELLASHGFTALSVAYFQGANGGQRYPELPKTLTDIPIEYFAGAAAWLARQPSVDHDHLWVSGGSRGSEAALLLGALRPDLVHGVLALSPTNSAQCSYTGARNSCDHGAWTWQGKQVPYTRDWNVVAPKDNPQAEIAVEKISGPVLAVCGGSDLLWDACPYSTAIMSRLAAHHRPYPRLLLSYPEAGHGVDLLIPYLPYVSAPGGLPTYGATPDANAKATADAWPKVLAFLTDHSR